MNADLCQVDPQSQPLGQRLLRGFALCTLVQGDNTKSGGDGFVQALPGHDQLARIQGAAEVRDDLSRCPLGHGQ